MWQAPCTLSIDFASFRTDWEQFYKNGESSLQIVIQRLTWCPNGKNTIIEGTHCILDWLEDFEFQKFGLPKPDAVCLLDMPLEVSEAPYGGAHW